MKSQKGNLARPQSVTTEAQFGLSFSFSISYLGSHDVGQGKMLHKLIQSDDFRVVVVADVETVELCGALKVMSHFLCPPFSDVIFVLFHQNIVGVGAGIIDGLEYGDNTKAAVIRLGLMEMVRFAQVVWLSTQIYITICN